MANELRTLSSPNRADSMRGRKSWGMGWDFGGFQGKIPPNPVTNAFTMLPNRV